MKHAVAVIAVLTAATTALPAAAQDTDFSGTWQLDDRRAGDRYEHA